MSLWQILFGGGVRDVITAANDTVKTIHGDQAARDAQHLATRQATLGQFAAEFARPPSGPFDALVDGINRLPRPIMALSTVGLFAFAMYDPAAFAVRMQGLALIPEPLWWLLGTIVAFYFGAREAEKRRRAKVPSVSQVAAVQEAARAIQGPAPARTAPGDENPALEAWKEGGAQ